MWSELWRRGAVTALELEIATSAGMPFRKNPAIPATGGGNSSVFVCDSWRFNAGEISQTIPDDIRPSKSGQDSSISRRKYSLLLRIHFGNWLYTLFHKCFRGIKPPPQKGWRLERTGF